MTLSRLYERLSEMLKCLHGFCDKSFCSCNCITISIISSVNIICLISSVNIKYNINQYNIII